jgi:hypothetical protein
MKNSSRNKETGRQVASKLILLETTSPGIVLVARIRDLTPQSYRCEISDMNIDRRWKAH